VILSFLGTGAGRGTKTVQVTVRFMAQLKRAAGKASETLTLAHGYTLRDLVLRLARDNVSLAGFLLDPAGTPQPSLLLFVGDEQVRSDSARPIQEGDVVTLLTPMAGGLCDHGATYSCQPLR